MQQVPVMAEGTYYVINETLERIESAWNNEEYAEEIAGNLNYRQRPDVPNFEYSVARGSSFYPTKAMLDEYDASGRWY